VPYRSILAPSCCARSAAGCRLQVMVGGTGLEPICAKSRQLQELILVATRPVRSGVCGRLHYTNGPPSPWGSDRTLPGPAPGRKILRIRRGQASLLAMGAMVSGPAVPLLGDVARCTRATDASWASGGAMTSAQASAAGGGRIAHAGATMDFSELAGSICSLRLCNPRNPSKLESFPARPSLVEWVRPAA
jgi:hypothetical protein